MISSPSIELSKDIGSAINKINRTKWCSVEIGFDASRNSDIVIVAHKIKNDNKKKRIRNHDHASGIFCNDIYQYVINSDNVNDINIIIKVDEFNLNRTKI